MPPRDADDPTAAQFTVRVSRRRSTAAREFVIRSSGPLAAAIEGFERCSGTWPEVVDVHSLQPVGAAGRSLRVTFASSGAEPFHVHVRELLNVWVPKTWLSLE